MIKKIFVFVLCLFVFLNQANAGLVKKVAGVGAIYLVKYEAKKITKAQAKKSAEKLVQNELKTGSYKSLTKINDALKASGKTIENDAHHIPSQKFMNKFRVDAREAIAVNVEKTRHSLTRTYKGRNNSILKNNETPREALAKDIKNMKDIYRYEKKDLLKRNKNETDADYNLREKNYESNLRKSLKEVIKKNKDTFPHLFKK